MGLHKLDSLFRRDRHPLFKILGAAFCGGLLAAKASKHGDRSRLAVGVVAGVVSGAMIGTALVWRDSTLRRIADNEPVGEISRALFAAGILSVFVWCALLLVTSLVGMMCYEQFRVAPGPR